MSKILRKTGKIIGAGTFAWMWAPGAVTSYATDVSLTLQGSSGTGKLMDMLDIMFLFLFLAVVPVRAQHFWQKFSTFLAKYFGKTGA